MRLRELPGPLVHPFRFSRWVTRVDVGVPVPQLTTLAARREKEKENLCDG